MDNTAKKKDFIQEFDFDKKRKESIKTIKEVGSQKELATLYSKVARVMGAVGMIEKNGFNNFHNYEYATAEDIKEALRPLCAKENLWISSEIADYTKNVVGSSKGSYVEIELVMNFTLRCGDTGAMTSLRYDGYALDKGDKHIYKAYTGAMKYFLINNFMLSTGDDPEIDSPEVNNYSTTNNSSKGKEKNSYGGYKQNNNNNTPNNKAGNQKLGAIRSFWQQAPDIVSEIAFAKLESLGKKKDISLLTELKDDDLDEIINDIKVKLEEKKEIKQDENNEETSETEKKDEVKEPAKVK